MHLWNWSFSLHALIIEDQMVIAMQIEDALRSLNFRSFQIVDTESAAIEAATLRRPDLIIADQRLAIGTGVDAVRAISATFTTPVVFISGYRLEVRKLLHNAIVIGKPFNVHTLRDAVLQAMLLVR
jgi:DNA-binding response OmpR family regulator